MILALLGLGPLLVCAVVGPLEAGAELGQKAAPDWSRAARVGAGFYGTDSGAPLVVDDQGRVHLLWALRTSAGEYDIRYTRLDNQGVVEEEHDLGAGLYEPRKMQILRGSDVVADVFLLASFAQGAHSGLYHFALTSEGELAGPPSLLSSRGSDCFEYDVARDATGLVHVFYTEGAGPQRDLHYVALDPEAGDLVVPRLLARGVTSPVCAVGPGNALHVFWKEPGSSEDLVELHHAVVEGPMPNALSGPRLLDLPAGRIFSHTGPVVAFDADYAYLVWTVEYRRELASGAVAEGWYGSLALESPSEVLARPFTLPVEEQPTYVTHASPYAYEYLVPIQGETEFGTERISYPSALLGDREAMVTAGMTMLRGVGLEHQIVNLVFSGGELLGYQVAGNTTHWSRLSHLVADRNGQLHLSWVDGLEPGPSDVFYASTSPAVQERVDHLTGDDLLFAGLNTAFSAVAGLPALPLAIAWLVPPLVWAFLASRFLLGGQGLTGPRGYVVLVVGAVLYEAAKLYFSPGMLGYVPFSVSVPFLPVAWYDPLRALVPVAILGAGGLGVALALLRTEVRNLLAATLILCLIDAFLTLIIYGPGLAVLG